jgi:alpha-N-acetylglucosaminidase
MHFIRIALLAAFPHLDAIQPQSNAATQEDAARDLIRRLIGTRADEFLVKVDFHLLVDGKDVCKVTLCMHLSLRGCIFTGIRTLQISTDTGKVSVTASSGVGVAWGFYYYIREYCGAHVMWAGNQTNLPATLPSLPSAGITIAANDKYTTHFLNL